MFSLLLIDRHKTYYVHTFFGLKGSLTLTFWGGEHSLDIPVRHLDGSAWLKIQEITQSPTDLKLGFGNKTFPGRIPKEITKMGEKTGNIYIYL